MSIGLFFQRQIRLIVSRLPAAITALIRAPQVFPSNSLCRPFFDVHFTVLFL
jgi:hypothetical protein